MLNAYDWADWQRDGDDKLKPITVEFITHFGMLVEPFQNIGGIRRIPISIGYEVRQADRLPERLNSLIEAYYDGRLIPDHHSFNGDISKNEVRVCTDCGKDYSAHTNFAQTSEDVFYFEYEMIHPFADGNGRSGKILYNYLLDKMDDPKMPPNFFGSSNP